MWYNAWVIFLESMVCALAVFWMKRERGERHTHSTSLIRLDGMIDGIFLGIGAFEFLPHALEEGKASGFSVFSVFSLFAACFVCVLWTQSRLGLSHKGACCPSDFRKTLVSRSALWLLSVHAILEGIALGVVQQNMVEQLLLYSIMLHKGLESMAFASAALTAVPHAGQAMVWVFLFACMTPLGIFSGHALTLWMHAVGWFAMNLVTAVSFIYMGLECILNRPDERMKHLPSLVFGWALVGLVVWFFGVHAHS